MVSLVIRRLVLVVVLASSGFFMTGCPGLDPVQQGLHIAPVTLNLDGKDARLVGLGSYIVNAQAGCADCHSHPLYAEGGDPFQGQAEQVDISVYLSGGREFGPFTSANITPDANGLPAGLTFQQFLNVMRTGADPHAEGSLLQVMPWPAYKNMTYEDLRAVYEYLRAIPSLLDNPYPGA